MATYNWNWSLMIQHKEYGDVQEIKGHAVNYIDTEHNMFHLNNIIADSKYWEVIGMYAWSANEDEDNAVNYLDPTPQERMNLSNEDWLRYWGCDYEEDEREYWRNNNDYLED